MKRLFTTILILGGIGLGLFIWWKQGLQAVDSTNKNTKIFVVEKGEGVKDIANQLRKEGLIKDPIVFFLVVKKEGYDDKIQAGDFRLSPSQNARDIAETLTHGTLDIWVTIPEGKRADEIADILKEKMPQYQDTWRDILNQNEGYLFPDTYLIPKDATINAIVTIMTNNFYSKIGSIGLSKDSPNLKKIVTIASLLEREAKTNDEKPVIAGIINNRLDEGMALQIDATIQYAKGKVGSLWWAPVGVSEYKSVKSIYNTYLFPGLPPGPISNPGLPSLQAAAHPQETSYVYYLHDRNGNIHYATTNDQQNANIEKYSL